MTKRLLVAMAVALLGPLGAVSTAHADTNDNKFLAEMKTEGITDHISASTRSRPVIASAKNLTAARQPRRWLMTC